MQHAFIVGVMGGARVGPEVAAEAYRLGRRIAEQGWVLLNGGRRAGVMDESARGALEAGGLTIGILPGEDRRDASPYIRIPICTGMGGARNNINVLSSDVVVACPGGAGTLSEIALALKNGKRVIVLGETDGDFPMRHLQGHHLIQARNAEEAVNHIRRLFFPDSPE